MTSSNTSGVVADEGEVRPPASHSDDNELILVFAADENFVMPLAATLYSALANLERGRALTAYVVDAGISDLSKERLERLAEEAPVPARLRWISTDESLLEGYDIKLWPCFTVANTFRLRIAELLPDHLERVLYIDCDMIVEADLWRLWQTDFEGNALLAVRDLGAPYVSAGWGIANWKELGLDPDTPYFNAGLMLMNLDVWRREKLGQQVLEYLSRYGDQLNIQGTQEGLNAVLAGRWGSLDWRWNLLHFFYEDALFEQSELKDEIRGQRQILLRNPYIIHYAAHPKPWHPGCTHPERKRFLHYLRESGWFDGPEYTRWRMRMERQRFVIKGRAAFDTLVYHGRSLRHGFQRRFQPQHER